MKKLTIKISDYGYFKDEKTKREKLAKIPTWTPPMPERKCEGDHGIDLPVAEGFFMPPGGVVKVATGRALEIPAGYAVELDERSSTAGKYDMFVMAGLIDSGYRGHVYAVFGRMPKVSLWEALRGAYRAGYLPWSRPLGMLRHAWAYYRRRNRVLYFPKGSVLMQMKIVQTVPAELVYAKTLSPTKRGSGGFGSTDKLKSKQKQRKERITN